GAGDLATWLGSIGTIGAFVVAFWQIRRERVERQRREQREWWARLREHADQITAWVAKNTLTISNSSHHLVHDVDVEFGMGSEVHLEHIEPGTIRQELETPHASGAVAGLRFTDARGQRWHRQGGQRPHLLSEGGEPVEAGGR